jgi:hypothetical protein
MPFFAPSPTYHKLLPCATALFRIGCEKSKIAENNTNIMIGLYNEN